MISNEVEVETVNQIDDDQVDDDLGSTDLGKVQKYSLYSC